MSQKKAVLLVAKVTGISINGPDSWALRLLPWLRAQGIDARAAVLWEGAVDEKAGLVALLRQADVPTTAQCSLNMRADVSWLMEQVAEFRPGLFIANHVPAALYAALNLQSVGVKSAMMIHSDDPYYYKLVDAFVLLGAKSAVDMVIPVSKFLEDKLEHSLKNRVSVSRIHYGAPRSTEVAKWESEDLHLLYVGRLSIFQKRADEVARALCAACDQIPGVRASMVGDGADRRVVETILRTTRGGEKVKLMGGLPSPEVLKILPTAHVMVLLSDFEGIPISLMEGMAAGLVPVVTPILSGIPELVFHETTGMIVQDREVDFVAVIRRLKESPELWKQLSIAARAHFEQGYSPEIVVNSWMKVIGDAPHEFLLPENIEFPVSSWLDSWVDGSMATGRKKYVYLLQQNIWRFWGIIPHWIKRFVRFALKLLKAHDGFQLKHAEDGGSPKLP